jgi:acyl carrier protein
MTIHDSAIPIRIENLVLSIHQRNGGALSSLNLDLVLLDKSLLLDSLDLAEVMVAVEREFNCSPFSVPPPPRTWRDLVNLIQNCVERRNPE